MLARKTFVGEYKASTPPGTPLDKLKNFQVKSTPAQGIAPGSPSIGSRRVRGI